MLRGSYSIGDRRSRTRVVTIATWANASLIYSLPLASLTAAILFGRKIFSRYQPATLFTLSVLIYAAGLALSANSGPLLSLYIFYGILFGAANGIGYSYALQLAGQATPAKKGFGHLLRSRCDPGTHPFLLSY